MTRLENLTFYGPGYWGEYLGASRPMLFCVTLCSQINLVLLKGQKSFYFEIKSMIRINRTFSKRSTSGAINIQVASALPMLFIQIKWLFVHSTNNGKAIFFFRIKPGNFPNKPQEMTWGIHHLGAFIMHRTSIRFSS